MVRQEDQASAAAGPLTTPVVEVRGVDKRYGGVHALRGVTLGFEHGTIHGLVGENGAGKSTLAKVLAGVTRPGGGTVAVDGVPVDFRSPRDALGAGVTLIAQELALEPQRTVFENVMLGTEPRRAGGLLRRDAMIARFRALNESAGFDLSPRTRVGSLRQADQQKVEILRALARDTRVVIMDEPTAALTDDEAHKMWELIGMLRDRGKTIIVVSHFLDEILRVSDRVSVLRDGHLVTTALASELTTDALVQAMVGRGFVRKVPDKPTVAPDAPTVLEVRHLSNAVLRDVSVHVRAGEIVGLAGLVGSGRTELARAIFGADRYDAGGEVRVSGRVERMKSPRDAIRKGVALIPESRKEGGLILGRSTADNVSLPHLARFVRGGLVRRGRERQRVAQALSEAGVRATAVDQPVRSLSGGNQQKTLFAKWLCETPTVLLADEPTRGVDVGAKVAIYELLVSLAERGMGILMISSETEEVLALANRIVVMRNGGVVGELSAGAEEHEVLRLAFGLHEEHEHSVARGPEHG